MIAPKIAPIKDQKKRDAFKKEVSFIFVYFAHVHKVVFFLSISYQMLSFVFIF